MMKLKADDEPEKRIYLLRNLKNLKEPLNYQVRKDLEKKKQSESVVLSVPAESIMYQDVPLGERLKSKSPNVLIKAPQYYLNNREIFVNFINTLFFTIQRRN